MLIFLVLAFVLQPAAQAQSASQDSLDVLHRECFAKNLGRSCVRLGTTLWQDPKKRIEAKAAFNQGCDLKIESACALKDLKPAPGDTGKAGTPENAKPQASKRWADPNKTIDRRDATHFVVPREIALKHAGDLSATLASATMEADTGKGKIIRGYRFTEIAPGSVFLKLGFLPGDILTHVNDEPVTSSSQAMALLPTLAYQVHFEVKLIREGKTLTQEYDLAD